MLSNFLKDVQYKFCYCCVELFFNFLYLSSISLTDNKRRFRKVGFNFLFRFLKLILLLTAPTPAFKEASDGLFILASIDSDPKIINVPLFVFIPLIDEDEDNDEPLFRLTNVVSVGSLMILFVSISTAC